MLINNKVNDEDKTLCERVQQGLATHAYEPGPLSLQESAISSFHEMIRERIPVASLREQPSMGSVAAENLRLVKTS